MTAGSTARATLTINDDEAPPPLQLSVYYRSARYSVLEGRSITVTVNLSAASDRPLSVPITATSQTAEAGDYRLSGLADGTLFFARGDRNESFTFTALQDDDADDEQVSLGFGPLPANVAAGSRALGAVTIEDDDLTPVTVKSTNQPPYFAEGETAFRTVAEQVALGTPIGRPVTANDPDGDILTYFLSGADASRFSLDSGTGQLRALGQLDMEIRATHLLNLSVSDGRGGTDSITVVVNLSDIQEVPVPSPSTQAVGPVAGEGSFYLETPDGTAAVGLPEGTRKTPYFVRVESAAVNCGGPWPAGSQLALLTVQLYDSLGNAVHDHIAEDLVATLRFDSLVLGGAEALQAAQEQGAIQVYRYREQEGDWSPLAFTLDLDELEVATLTVRDLRGPVCLAAIYRPPLPEESPPVDESTSEPEASDNVAWASNEGGRPWSRDSGDSDTSIPVVDAGGSDGPPAGDSKGDPTMSPADLVRELPWWPRLFLVLGAVLLVGAVAWQFWQSIREKHLSNRTFTRPHNSIWKSIFRA